MPGYAVTLTPAAERHLAKLGRTDREVVAAALVTLAHNPRPTACRKLHGTPDLWRLRVGRFRIIYAIIDERLVVIAVKIGDRKDVYR